MNLLDAAICLGLAARIHGTDGAVKKTAKRLAKRVHPNLRPALRLVCESRKPMKMVELMLADL